MKQRYIFSLIFAFSAVFFLTGSLHAQLGETENGETLATPASAPSDSGIYKGINQLPESVRRSAPFARVLEQMTRRAGTAGVWDEEARVKAFEQSQHDLIRASAVPAEKGSSTIQPLANAAWTSIGLTGSSNNNVFSAGCTTAIAIDPTNTRIMYVGGTSGGVWKSTNYGANWVSLTDLAIPNQSIASIAIDPKNHNTLYVGTGNGFASVDELTGTGIYKSTDGGGTWKRIGSTTLSGTIMKVLVDPAHSNVILASTYSTNRGVYRSTDSGVTWTKVYTAQQPVWDIAAGTVIGGTPLFYFAEGNNVNGASSECGLYKSGNDGVTWTKITGNLPAGDSIGRCSLSIPSGHPERVFVLMANPAGDVINELRSLFRATDNGVTWTDIPVPVTLFDPTSQQAPQGWYDCSLALSPFSSSTADTLFIGGIEAYYSYNSGGTWVNYSDNNTWPWQASHVDHHSFAFNPNHSDTVYDGCDGGLYWSIDAGFANPNTDPLQSSWSYRSNQMTTNRFYHIGLDPSDSKTTLGGAQDQGTWKLVTQTNPVLIGGGDGLQPISNSTNSTNPYYYELPLGDIYDHNNNLLTGSISDNAYWDAPFKMAIATNGGLPPEDILYTGREHLWISTDQGQDWNAISPAYGYPYIRSIGLSHTDVNTIYLGSTGEISITTDGGGTWTSQSSGMPSAMVTAIVTTAHNTNFALASFYTQSGHRVMRTTNKGSTWTDASGVSGSALPLVGVNCVALDSIDPLRIWYAATDNGIYYTVDSGSHWSVAGAGIGLASCSDVEVQANKITIRVATFGRGIWEGATNTLPVELSSLTYQKQTSGTVGTTLDWHTDSELGDAFFGVERSLNGGAFQEIAQVPTKAPGGTSSTELDYAFFDSTHAPGEYIYQLKQVSLDGSIQYSNFVELNWGTTGLIVSQNYPNPFLVGTPSTSPNNNTSSLLGSNQSPSISPWPVTRFHYELPSADVVTLKIYNSTGTLVRTLLDQVQQQPGDPDAFWDGTDQNGSFLPSGTYFYVVETGHSGTVVNKLILLSN